MIGKDVKMNKSGLAAIKQTSVILRKHLLHANVPATIGALDELIKICDYVAIPDAATLALWLGQVTSRLQDEISSRSIILLSGDEARMFSPEIKKSIQDAFPQTIEDLEEASKCLAFGRFTASVFHLMRGMEGAVKVLCRHLDIVNVDLDWGKLLSAMESKIKDLPKGENKDKWSESHVHLYHVKQAWRNGTMHPKKTYSEEQAVEAFRAVNSFMGHLAMLVQGPSA
ncbi:hypothetical protein H5J25_05025 [Sphingomonas aliaeris]|uniref:HEPN domain-containing protein n=1 Tax=Sphingomonas aliaeris TaxID=2759526 RepID=A0A974NWI9_9SPHN|nr:hypothetical protein [Sphingomonas aliaeris]QQV78097.1 hypothetical protein H5J25_05025 [Sphingomonas aliaeris]